MAAKQTAVRVYNQRRNDVVVLLDLIQMELDGHAQKARSAPTDWGYAGDLGNVRDQLKNVLIFLMGWRDEDEAHRAIDEQLESAYEDRRQRRSRP